VQNVFLIGIIADTKHIVLDRDSKGSLRSWIDAESRLELLTPSWMDISLRFGGNCDKPTHWPNFWRTVGYSS